MSYSVDVNILLYASDASGPYHERASAFLQECAISDDLLYLTWPTIMGYLRIATHPSVFSHPLSPGEATRNVSALLDLAQVRVLTEDRGFWDTYRDITSDTPTRGNMVPDAHVAALLKAHRVKVLYTNDSDFLRFAFLQVRNPVE